MREHRNLILCDRVKPEMTTALGLVLLIVIFATASTALAKSGDRLQIGAELNVRASNGYRVTIGGSGEDIALAVTHKRTMAIYRATSGRVTRDSIRARFGPFGLIDVSFVPHRTRSGRPRHRKPICRYKPARPHYRVGAFVGVIRFRGEGGYASVSAGRAFGRVAPVPRKLCGMVGAGHAFDHLDHSPGWPTELTALAFTNSGIAIFEAGRDAFGSFADGVDRLGRFRVPKLGGTDIGFEVLVAEKRGEMSVLRLAVARGGRDSYEFAESPRNLDVTPPLPFRGVGRYRSCAEQRWSGSLAASLPGAGRVALSNSPGGQTLAAAFAVPEFHESQCGVIPLSRSRLRP
jgi:hypothetical protein